MQVEMNRVLLVEGRAFKRIKGKIREWKEQSKQMEEAKVEALTEHLKWIGLDATKIAFTEEKLRIRLLGAERVLGSVRVTNRHIDMVELAEFYVDVGSTSDTPVMEPRFRCHYVVHVKVDGLEDRLKAKLKPMRKGFFSREILDFKWRGKELAQMLNSDTDLKEKLSCIENRNVEVKPYGEHQCVRIRQDGGTIDPAYSFPTIETFEAYDKIAQNIRCITG